MSMENYTYLLSGVRAPFDAPPETVLQIAREKMKRVCSSAAELHFRLYKKSLDARRPGEIFQVCTVLITAPRPLDVSGSACSSLQLRALCEERPAAGKGTARMSAPPLVVGMGPAGLFSALFLAEAGFAPTLIDRGEDVTARAAAVAAFTAGGALNPESNIQFGAGGAGTFSDGKLITRVNDPYCHYVLDRLVEFGAPAEILTRAKPHIGTDILRRVVENLLARIRALGGRVLYRTRLCGFEPSENGMLARTSAGDIRAGALLLGIGHSARDTFRMLREAGVKLEVKPFSVGVRIEHLQLEIDRALYGRFAGHPALGPAEYGLSDTTGERGVYTFCMCPGGTVVAAASEEGGVVTNGMSYHSRDGLNANAALAVSVLPSDVGGTVEGAVSFQRMLERAAFAAGGGDYRAPVETVGDFLSGYRGTEPSRILPTYGGGRVTVADLSAILPPQIVRGLSAGICSFGRKLRGFDCPEAVLTGLETRTSSPVRILRGEDRTAPGFPFLYPMGEGAGYAGGITSAALDGLRTAQVLTQRFAPGGDLL